MKSSPKGPFERIRWYCNDGTVLPPKAYACKKHGGGVQHGEWNERTPARCATPATPSPTCWRASTPDPSSATKADLEALNQILLERFLVNVDDGWIFRGARSYRGALQVEDEEAGARALLLAMLADPEWLTAARFARLREAIRLLPLPRGDEASAARVRAPGPGARRQGQALHVPCAPRSTTFPKPATPRRCASTRAAARRRPMRKEYERLAAEPSMSSTPPTGSRGGDPEGRRRRESEPRLAEDLRKRAAALAAASEAGPAASRGEQARWRSCAMRWAQHGSPEQRLVLLEASLALEDDAYTTGNGAARRAGSRQPQGAAGRGWVTAATAPLRRGLHHRAVT